MIHYLTEYKAAGDIATAFPHDPTDIPQSVTDYLEDKLSNGWELVNFVGESTTLRFVFRASGRDT